MPTSRSFLQYCLLVKADTALSCSMQKTQSSITSAEDDVLHKERWATHEPQGNTEEAETEKKVIHQSSAIM